MITALIDERRKHPRVAFESRVEVDMPELQRSMEGSSVNFSDDGLCVRLPAALEVRSSITLRLFAQARQRPIECSARVAWVVQRLDLRASPPFVYDIGVAFMKPSARLRQMASRLGVSLKPAQRAPRAAPGSPGARHALQPALIHGRRYEPRLTDGDAGPNRWHLVIQVDGAPCFSQRYPSEREVLEAWKRFKRQLVASRRR